MGRIAYVLGLVALAMMAVTAATVTAGRPFWSYHNAGTLAAKPAAYQTGYLAGVVDGYFAAQRGAPPNDEAVRLDRCISSGWTTAKLEAELTGQIVPGARAGRKPAAELVISALAARCP